MPPVLMSSCVAFAGASGRARGAFGASLLEVSGCCSEGAEEFEELVVEDIVNVRSGLSNGCLCLVKMELGARRGRRVMKVRMGEKSEIVLANKSCDCYGVFYGYMY